MSETSEQEIDAAALATAAATATAEAAAAETAARVLEAGKDAGTNSLVSREAGEGTSGEAAEGTKGDEANAGAPETYEDFTMPEGMEVDKVAIEAFLPIAKELNLTQDQAQKLVSLQTAQVNAAAEAQNTAWTKTVDDWHDATVNDPTIGGANLAASLTASTKFLDKFASPELRALLDTSGMGNHVEFIRLFKAAGEAMSEDGITSGSANPNKPGLAERLYGKTTPV